MERPQFYFDERRSDSMIYVGFQYDKDKVDKVYGDMWLRQGGLHAGLKRRESGLEPNNRDAFRFGVLLGYESIPQHLRGIVLQEEDYEAAKKIRAKYAEVDMIIDYFGRKTDTHLQSGTALFEKMGILKHHIALYSPTYQQGIEIIMGRIQDAGHKQLFVEGLVKVVMPFMAASERTGRSA